MPTQASRARGLFPAAALLGLEAVAAAVLGVLEFVHLEAARLVAGLTTGVMFLAYAALLGALAGGVLGARGLARGGAVFTQLLQLALAYSFWSPVTRWVSIALGLTAAATLVLLFLPSSTAAFTAERPEAERRAVKPVRNADEVPFPIRRSGGRRRPDGR